MNKKVFEDLLKNVEIVLLYHDDFKYMEDILNK